MTLLTSHYINAIRASGFRPEVGICLLHHKKLLMLYDQKHDLWQLPQGGIKNGETAEAAFKREGTEELGAEIMGGLTGAGVYIAQEQLRFKTSDSKSITTDDGTHIPMQGKEYFFIAAETAAPQLDILETQFDEYKWCNYAQALETAQGIYQKGKQKITVDVVEELKRLELIT
jgi:8-oxo-dGTP pyrophosphatase MutT (NUDIX family)